MSGLLLIKNHSCRNFDFRFMQLDGIKNIYICADKKEYSIEFRTNKEKN